MRALFSRQMWDTQVQHALTRRCRARQSVAVARPSATHKCRNPVDRILSAYEFTVEMAARTAYSTRPKKVSALCPSSFLDF
jgi:hypothetical protein